MIGSLEIAPSPEWHSPESSHSGSDEALGIYLKQMGAVPLLTRSLEYQLAERLDNLRARFRRAALHCPAVAHCAFLLIQAAYKAGRPVDPFVDAVLTDGRSKDQIAARLPHHMQTLPLLFQRDRHLSCHADKASLRFRNLRKIAKLMLELSPRCELLEKAVCQWISQVQMVRVAIRRQAANLNAPPEEDELYRSFGFGSRALDAFIKLLERRHRAYKQARSELAEANLRLVVSIAKRYRNRGLPFNDLIQEGNRGLMRAVDKFEHRLGYKFGTYATWWIRQGITRSIQEYQKTARVPDADAPPANRIGDLLSTEPVPHHRWHGKMPLSLHEPIGEDGERFVEDFVSEREETRPGEAFDRGLLRERIQEVLKSLAPREKEIIEMRFGLLDGKGRTLDEVARFFGVTRERIRQIESRSLGKLRINSRSTRLEAFQE